MTGRSANVSHDTAEKTVSYNNFSMNETLKQSVNDACSAYSPKIYTGNNVV